MVKMFTVNWGKIWNELMESLPSFHLIKFQIYFEYELSTHDIHIFQNWYVAFSSKITFSPTICQYRWMKMVWIPKMTHETHINIDLVNWIWNDCSSICIKFLFCFLDLNARPQISICWFCWLLIMPVGWGHFKIIVLLVSRRLRFLWKQQVLPALS